MRLENKIKYKCDLCFAFRVKKTDKLPKDWLQIEVAETGLDRFWHKKNICDFCLDLIKEKLHESNS